MTEGTMSDWTMLTKEVRVFWFCFGVVVFFKKALISIVTSVENTVYRLHKSLSHLHGGLLENMFRYNNILF